LGRATFLTRYHYAWGSAAGLRGDDTAGLPKAMRGGCGHSRCLERALRDEVTT
jgi:hypothetical protein